MLHEAGNTIVENEKQINGLNDLIEIVNFWEEQINPEPGKPPWIWYRGQPDAALDPIPGALRPNFLEQADQLFGSLPKHDRGLELERRINDEFRRRGCSCLGSESDLVRIYLMAQHYGLPTRLLDWTTNPLAALFFAVCDEKDKSGKLFVSKSNQFGDDYFPETQRDPNAVKAIKNLFGEGPPLDKPGIIPVLPDLLFPRMLQQASCFTLHTPGCENLDFEKQQLSGQTAPSSYEIPALQKEMIEPHLRRLGVHWSSLFPELDYIAREICAVYGISKNQPIRESSRAKEVDPHDGR